MSSAGSRDKAHGGGSEGEVPCKLRTLFCANILFFTALKMSGICAFLAYKCSKYELEEKSV